MPSCVLRYCRNYSRAVNKNHGITYHGFPRPGKEKREEWIKFVQKNRREETWKPSEDSRICSLHFKDSDKYTTKTGRTYLKRSAEPFDFPETAIPDTPDAEEQAGIRRRSLLPLIKRAEDIIVRVYNYLQTEYEELKSSIGANCDLSPLADILKRTAAATGTSEQTVSAILEEKKRSADDERDAVAAKRAKMTQDAGDRNPSPITDEESRCEEQEDIAEQDDYNEQTQYDSQEREECSMETLKVEIEDDTYYRPPDPLQSQPSERNSAGEHQLPPTDIANVIIKTEPIEVKIEPIDIEYSESSCGVVASLPRVKTEPDDAPPHRTQQSSQGSQKIIIETGYHQDQLNTRHTINVIVNNNKKEHQKRYREQNRDKLKQREAERRKRKQYSQSIAGPSTSSKTNGIELNNEEIITAQSSSGSEKIQPSSIQRNDQGNELNALQKKRERQQRYREQNRDKLKQREAERRRRLQNADGIARTDH